MWQHIHMFVLVGLLSFCNGVSAQDAHYSMPWENPLYTNPALTGKIRGNHRLVYVHRRQWGIGASTYQTQSASYDINIMKEKWGLKGVKSYLGAGISYNGDKAGDLNFGKQSGTAYLSYSLMVAQNHDISFGVGGGFSQYKLDLSNAQWSNQWTNGVNTDGNSDYSRYNRPVRGDLSVGAVWTYLSEDKNRLNNETLLVRFGLSMANLITSGQTDRYDPLINRYRRLNIHAEAVIASDRLKGNTVRPYVLFSKQGPSMESVFGASYRLYLESLFRSHKTRSGSVLQESAIFIGGYYRTDKTLIIVGGFEFRNAVISFGYDFNVLRDSARSRFNSLELALRIRFPDPFGFSEAGWDRKRFNLRLKNH